jgi:hypothetical protein
MSPGIYLSPTGILWILEFEDYWEFLEGCEYLGEL